jgi:hypothetical protein
MLFRGVATRDLAELADVRLAFAYGLTTITLFLGTAVVAARMFGLDRPAAIFHGLGAVQSNNGFLALPLIPALFGVAAIAPLALTLLADMVALYPLCILLADIDHARTCGLAARVGGRASSQPFIRAVHRLRLATLSSACRDQSGDDRIPRCERGPGGSSRSARRSRSSAKTHPARTAQVALMNAVKLAVMPVPSGRSAPRDPLSPFHLKVGVVRHCR